jgi:UTP--glucose-1-phosphate uridylyltransferase
MNSVASQKKSVVRKAVIPIAGLGTRHFPASHAVKKELFPVVGPDGIARALFHYHLIEFDAAGIEEICIIIQPGEDELVRAYLRGPDSNYLKRLEKHPVLLREAGQMRKFAGRVTFAVQHQQEGYGHAVFQTKNFAGGEFVLLGLGNHLFRGRPISPYQELAQMTAVSNGRNVSAVNRISAGELKGYGTIAGQRRAENPPLIDVSLIVEKPDAATVRKKLRVDGLPDETWLGWFWNAPAVAFDLRNPRRNDPQQHPRQRRIPAYPRTGDSTPARRLSGAGNDHGGAF